jgi:hypothetical protein
MPHFVHERMSSQSSSSRSSLSESCDDITPRATTFPRPTLPPFPPKTSVSDDTSQLRLMETSVSALSSPSSSSLSSASSSQSIGARKSILRRGKNARSLDLQKASDRRSYFASPKHRQDVFFGPNVRILQSPACLILRGNRTF